MDCKISSCLPYFMKQVMDQIFSKLGATSIKSCIVVESSKVFPEKNFEGISVIFFNPFKQVFVLHSKVFGQAIS